MNKKIPLLVLSFFAVVISSTMALNYWKPDKIERPEGYSKPDMQVEIQSPKGPVRVMELDIDKNANKYFASGATRSFDGRYALEMTALTPGSGWLKWKTRDGISPIIDFKKVTQRDVQRFNQFSESLGMPVRLALSGKALQIFTKETEADLARYAQQEKIKHYRAPNGFYKPKAPVQVAFKRDKNGRVFIVKKEDKGLQKPSEAVAAK